MVYNVCSLGLTGMNGYVVSAECDLSAGLPGFDVVGLPDAAVKEARDRVRSAIKNCGFSFPVSRVTVNLAPANVKKSGTIYDLPILIGILAAGGQLKLPKERCAFVGELSLSGEVRPFNGMLPMALAAAREGIEVLYVPEKNAPEATLADGIRVYPVRDIASLVAHLQGETLMEPEPKWLPRTEKVELPDLSDVKGQEAAKRALEVAAAGGHHILMSGSPGSGKSMLAKRLPSILPSMTRQESLETTEIHSVMGLTSREQPMITRRPFRSPHHTMSAAAMAGGGQTALRPGEISLAHNGVMFLDEFPEFHRDVLEALRAPLEDGRVQVSRAVGTETYPARFMMVCAMNPCRCGWHGHASGKCRCSDLEVKKYTAKLSGPMMDRIDIHVQVPSLVYDELSQRAPGEPSSVVQARVQAARDIQVSRFAQSAIDCNAQMSSAQLRTYCKLDEEGERLMKRAYDKMNLTGRSYDRILRVARTIADLAASPEILAEHLAEALQYRPVD